MSSAILYLAIVGIWALVLVPRWLRPSRASGTLESNLAEPVYASPPEDLAEAAEDADGGEGTPGDQSPAQPSAAERRARVLQARRRMLVTLIVLTAGAAAIAAAHLAASWVVIPPDADAGRLCAAAARSGPYRHRARPGGRFTAQSRSQRPGTGRHRGPAGSTPGRLIAARPGHPTRRSSTSRPGSATSSTTSTPMPRCAPSATDRQPPPGCCAALADGTGGRPGLLR